MSEDFLHKRPRAAAMTRTTSRREIICNTINETIEERDSLRVVEGASNVLVKDMNSHLKGEEVTKPLDFLHFCGICGRSLGLERDIFIYRGESAFCSIECREKQIRYEATKSTTSWHQ